MTPYPLTVEIVGGPADGLLVTTHTDHVVLIGEAEPVRYQPDVDVDPTSGRMPALLVLPVQRRHDGRGYVAICRTSKDSTP